MWIKNSVVYLYVQSTLEELRELETTNTNKIWKHTVANMNMQTYVTHWAMETTSNNFSHAGIAAVADYIDWLCSSMSMHSVAYCACRKVVNSR